jgi:hypothetical protein
LSYEDPFDNAPDENVKEVPVVEEKPVVESLDGKMTITFKGAGGYADRWVVVYAAGAKDGLDIIQDPAFKELLDYSRKIAEYDRGAASPAAPQQTVAPATGGAPQQSQEAPGGEKRFCNHGEMQFKTGVAKGSGKPYSLFSCTAPREQQCKAQFL